MTREFFGKLQGENFALPKVIYGSSELSTLKYDIKKYQ